MTASPADATLAVVVRPGKYQRQLPADVTVTLVPIFPALPDFTVLTLVWRAAPFFLNWSWTGCPPNPLYLRVSQLARVSLPVTVTVMAIGNVMVFDVPTMTFLPPLTTVFVTRTSPLAAVQVCDQAARAMRCECAEVPRARRSGPDPSRAAARSSACLSCRSMRRSCATPMIEGSMTRASSPRTASVPMSPCSCVVSMDTTVAPNTPDKQWQDCRTPSNYCHFRGTLAAC